MNAQATTTSEPPAAHRATARFRVVFVCVDHRSRSVIGERLLRRHADRAHAYHLDIVGVGGHKTIPAAGLDPASAHELARLGLDPNDGPVRQLTAADIASAGLILTFEREHRTEVFQYASRMMQRCFTVTELSAISTKAPEIRSLPLKSRVVAAAELRELGADAPDIPETWNQSARTHQAAATMIEAAVKSLFPLLAADVPLPSPCS